jgi:ribosome maturation factor RimP
VGEDPLFLFKDEYFEMLPIEIDNRLGEIRREIEALGAELVDIAVRRSSGTRSVVIVTADKENGITLDDCIAINRRLSDYFDDIAASAPEGGFFKSSYYLEVNSPGLDRPLKSEKDFRKAVGDTVRVVYRNDSGGASDFVDTIQKVEDGKIYFAKGHRDVSAIEIDRVIKAVREIKFKK